MILTAKDLKPQLPKEVENFFSDPKYYDGFCVTVKEYAYITEMVTRRKIPDRTIQSLCGDGGRLCSVKYGRCWLIHRREVVKLVAKFFPGFEVPRQETKDTH